MQDVVVTAVALGALIVLLQRFRGLVRPAKSSGCDRCTTCAPAGGATGRPTGSNAISLVPLATLFARSPSSSKEPASHADDVSRTAGA